MIDWQKPIETVRGSIPATLVWPESNDRSVEIQCGRWLFNEDGSNFNSPYGGLRNVSGDARQKSPTP